MHVTLTDLLQDSFATPHAALKHVRGSLELIQGLLKDAEIKMTENAKSNREFKRRTYRHRILILK